MGGEFSYDTHFKDWLTQRFLQELEADSTHVMQKPVRKSSDLRNADHQFSLPGAHFGVKTTGEASLIDLTAGSSNSKRSAKEIAQERNKQYARKHYYKRKKEVKHLREEGDALRKHKKRLLEEEGFLKSLLTKAKEVVSRIEGEQG